MKLRRTNMDIERMVLAVLVIILHYNNRDMGGALNGMENGALQEIFVRCTESFAICAVNSFVLLSGYFSAPGRQVPYRKAVYLLLACSFYRITGYLAHVFFITHDFSFRTLAGYAVPSNWFVCLFVTLMLISPHIDNITAGMDDKALNAFTGTLTLLFAVVPTFVSFMELGGIHLNGLATVTFTGDAAGFNIALFVTMYCLGIWIRRKSSYWDRFGVSFYLACYVLLALLIAAVSHFDEAVWNYSDILVVMEAVALTLMFTRIKPVGEKAGRIISAVAGCSLGIFIWHTMPVMIFGLWVHFDIAGSMVSGRGRMIGTFVLGICAMYVLSLAWVLACRLAVKKLKTKQGGDSNLQ